jgi:hypothetical protein
MTLENWQRNGWLQRLELSEGEIQGLLSAAEQDLRDARQDVSSGWRFAIGYNAALRLGTAALGKAGYRATRDQKHYRTIAALPLILGPDVAELSSFLDACRTKRHEVTYESVSAISPDEADALIEAVEELKVLVLRYLGQEPSPAS